MAQNRINAITKVVFEDGTEVGLDRWSDWNFYSTVELLSAFTDPELPVFTYGKTTNGSEKVTVSQNLTPLQRAPTETDTNLDTGGKMPAEQAFLCYGISIAVAGVGVVNDAAAPTQYQTLSNNLAYSTINTINNRLLFQLQVKQTPLHESHVGFYVAGFGATTGGQAGFQTATPQISGNNGQPGQHATVGFGLPIGIGSTETFKGLLLNQLAYPGFTQKSVVFFDDAGEPTPTQVAQLRVYLRGLRAADVKGGV